MLVVCLFLCLCRLGLKFFFFRVWREGWGTFLVCVRRGGSSTRLVSCFYVQVTRLEMVPRGAVP